MDNYRKRPSQPANTQSNKEYHIQIQSGGKIKSYVEVALKFLQVLFYQWTSFWKQ